MAEIFGRYRSQHDLLEFGQHYNSLWQTADFRRL